MSAPRHRATTILLASALLFWAAPAPAMQVRTNADLDDQIDRVVREFERTQELLEHVGGMLHDSNSPRVSDLFKTAVELQLRGRAMLQRAQSDTGALRAGDLVREALSLTLRARDIAQRAGSLLREQIGLEEQAQRTMERAQELLQRASDVDHGEDAQTAKILAEARRQLRAAQDHFADRNFDVALRLAESALKLLQTVADDSRDDDAGFRMGHEIERTERLLERAREHADELDDTGKTMLRRAAQLLDEAREAARRHEARRAQRLLQESRKLLRGLLEHGLDEVGPEDVRRGAARFDAALERLRQLVEDRPSPEIDDLIGRAIAAREDAVQSAAQGEYDRALAQLRAGLDLLGRAGRLAGGRR